MLLTGIRVKINHLLKSVSDVRSHPRKQLNCLTSFYFFMFCFLLSFSAGGQATDCTYVRDPPPTFFLYFSFHLSLIYFSFIIINSFVLSQFSFYESFLHDLCKQIACPNSEIRKLDFPLIFRLLSIIVLTFFSLLFIELNNKQKQIELFIEILDSIISDIYHFLFNSIFYKQMNETNDTFSSKYFFTMRCYAFSLRLTSGEM